MANQNQTVCYYLKQMFFNTIEVINNSKLTANFTLLKAIRLLFSFDALNRIKQSVEIILWTLHIVNVNNSDMR